MQVVLKMLNFKIIQSITPEKKILVTSKIQKNRKKMKNKKLAYKISFIIRVNLI